MLGSLRTDEEIVSMSDSPGESSDLWAAVLSSRLNIICVRSHMLPNMTLAQSACLEV